MRVVPFDDPVVFWTETRNFLERDEVGNTQLLAAASRHSAEPGPTPPKGFGLYEGDHLVGAAMRTQKGTLFISPADPSQLQALRDVLDDDGGRITDVVAEAATARAYVEIAGVPFDTHVQLLLYRLERVNDTATAAGAMRNATHADFDLICARQQAFFDEVAARESESAAQMVRRQLDHGGVVLWEVDGIPVAHAGHRPTPVRSARIGPVYTLPDRRGHGYAGSLVAALSRQLLGGGRLPLYLFADMSNPVANGVYQRVGFEAVGEHLHLVRPGRSH